MPLKRYGIYLGYPPTVDLRNEGLGRHLAEFLKGAQDREDIRFVIACPSWLRANLIQLCEACNVHADRLEIIAPHAKPLLLTAYQRYRAMKNSKRRPRRGRGRLARLRRRVRDGVRELESRLVSTRSIPLALGIGMLLSSFFAVGWVAGKLVSLPRLVPKLVAGARSKIPRGKPAPASPHSASGPKASPRVSFLARMYRLMEESEANLMRSMIEARDDVAAWYSPTAFWPHFNRIDAPRLMCVPDVVLTDFPTGFALVAGNELLDNFRQVERAIRGGEHFVTYSEETKWHTLVDRYGADPDHVFVVRHGANRLDDLVTVTGFEDNEEATNAFCRRLFSNALRKAVNNAYGRVSISSSVRFIFYASQFRPNKNVISLLKAYNHLIKHRFIGHKLILTGKPMEMSDVRRYVQEQNLQNDVLCLHGLTEQELAACYRLADLAVNPSLSEGGCPFTFTEAMSVGTPAVMARIPVTEEVINEPGLQEWMLFDPYDWEDMARRIEWALAHRELLHARQKPFYDKLTQRTWRNVVDEYVDILDRISSSGGLKDNEDMQGFDDSRIRRTCA